MSGRKRLRAGDRGKVHDTKFEVSSGNVFADLGLANPDERLAKAQLAAEINSIIEHEGWKQEQAAVKLKTHQPTISALRKGRLKSISYDRLMGWLVMLGRVVEIRVKPAKTSDPHVKVAIGARRLARLGGTEPDLKPIHRRRAAS